MKAAILFLSLFLFTSIQDKPSKQTKRDFKKLEWILSKWERTNVQPGTTAFESWQKSSKYVYTGMGVTLKGSDTTFVEKLRIEIKGDAIYYVADVKQNAAPTYFKMTKISESGFVSENPDHDFPKMISYELEGNNLTAVISDGGDQKMGFLFVKGK